MLSLSLYLTASDTAKVPHPQNVLPDRYCQQVSQKSTLLSHKLERQSRLAIQALLLREQRIRDKLAKINRGQADQLLGSSIDSLEKIKTALLQHKMLAHAHHANASVDSLVNTIKFLSSNNKLLAGNPSKLNDAAQTVQKLSDQFSNADAVKAILESQKDQLNQQLALFPAVSRELKALNQQAYYYGQQVNEYKEVLGDRKKAEAKALAILEQLPAYKAFISQHSQLAMLFNLQTAANSLQSTQGLQTRSAVERAIAQRLAGANPQSLSTQMDAARQQVQALKDKFPSLDNAGEMPNFKPKDLKTKSFRSRLEFGANTQFVKSNKFYPTTADIAGQIAYKFSKKGSAGFGAAYKLGMGDYNHIHFTSQGIGLRSFLDWKIKQSLYVNGGYELNHNTPFSSIDNLYFVQKWTGSALLGISKKIPLNARFKGNIMLLYDFLWSSHVPTSQPLILRMGYNF